jgi:hypothetical protein
MQRGPVWPEQRRRLGVMHVAINRLRMRSDNASDRLESTEGV